MWWLWAYETALTIWWKTTRASSCPDESQSKVSRDGVPMHALMWKPTRYMRPNPNTQGTLSGVIPGLSRSLTGQVRLSLRVCMCVSLR